ncbi:hypothetical protein DFH09DRAFT_1074915 [Mycena vulgaris]|nr:hypothetical protein DFH09DRAFT_1074915 [Mycena vulgaris]
MDLTIERPRSPDSIFSEHVDPPVMDATVITYDVSTTTQIFGLPQEEQLKRLRAYHSDFHEKSHEEGSLPATSQVVMPSSATTSAISITGICIQWKATWFTTEHLIACRDSDDEGPPPLEPTTASEPLSPTPAVPRVIPDSWGRRSWGRTDGEGIRAGLGLIKRLRKLGLQCTQNSRVILLCTSHCPVVVDLELAFIPASSLVRRTDGEGTEQAWAGREPLAPTLEMGEFFRHDTIEDDSGPLHSLRCNCKDGGHSAYICRHTYTFTSADGTLVIKKSKTMLLPLNYDSVTEAVTKYLQQKMIPAIAAYTPPGWELGAGASRRERCRPLLGSLPHVPHTIGTHHTTPLLNVPVHAACLWATFTRFQASNRTHNTGFYMSQDGRHTVKTGVNTGVKKRKIRPEDLVDSYGEWMPLPEDPGAGEGEGRESLRRELRGKQAESGSGTRARSVPQTQDETMKLWRPLIPRFLDEIVRAEGLVDGLDEGMATKTFWGAPLLMRTDQEWKGAYWVVTNLMSLGSVYQLGHALQGLKNF